MSGFSAFCSMLLGENLQRHLSTLMLMVGSRDAPALFGDTGDGKFHIRKAATLYSKTQQVIRLDTVQHHYCTSLKSLCSSNLRQLIDLTAL